MAKTVVITGSTRGIGYGMADSFLTNNCQVMICGRQQESVDQAVSSLAKKYSHERVAGQACDISIYTQVENLWDAAVRRFGRVDIWINNAGQANILTPFWELDPAQMESVVKTNLLGTMYGCRVAVRGMLKQGSGVLYNMEGFGSKGGRTQPGLALYGTTKAATAYLDTSLVKELEGKPILFGIISPGMVLTDMLLDQKHKGKPEDWERSKWAYNVLADRVETVTPWLVTQILKTKKHGTRIAFLSGAKVFWRFLSAPLTKRKVID